MDMLFVIIFCVVTLGVITTLPTKGLDETVEVEFEIAAGTGSK